MAVYSVDNAGKKTFDIIQNIILIVSIFELLILPEGSHFATDECFTKSLASRLRKVRPIITFHMKQSEYLENVQRIFLRPEIFFMRDIPN